MKKILILGFGKEGLSAANFLGVRNKVAIFDDKNKNQIDISLIERLKIKDAKFYFGGKVPKDEKFDLLVRSPGIRPDHKLIERFLKKGVKLTSPTNIFFQNCQGQIIGVTGTKGKGTTATLIHKILKASARDAFLAGNIGICMLDLLPKLKKESIVVLELSSFQLIDLKKSPNLAVILMITSEHLNWHKNQKEYLMAKESIVKFQTRNDLAIINYDFENSKKLASLTGAKVLFFSTNHKVNGVYVENERIISEIKGLEVVCKVSDILLPGCHNLQNVCAAIAVAKILQIDNNTIVKTLSTFKGLKHRLQLVKEVAQVKYYNDSYSTIPETTIAAINSISSPKILIMGGSSKNSDFLALANNISGDQSIKTLILIGQEAQRIKKAIIKSNHFKGKMIEGLKNMSEIVSCASKLAKEGDAVILSPACASFDMFKNYEDRGEQFINCVLALN